MYEFRFQKEHSLEKRKATSNQIITKYEDRVPVIIEGNNNKLIIEKKKFLVPKSHTMSNFIHEVRKFINIESDQGLYLMLQNGIGPKITETIETIYYKYKNEDGFLYIVICEESIFG